ESRPDETPAPDRCEGDAQGRQRLVPQGIRAQIATAGFVVEEKLRRHQDANSIKTISHSGERVCPAPERFINALERFGLHQYRAGTSSSRPMSVRVRAV